MEAGMSEIAVIGAGAWGTGLSVALGAKRHAPERLWAREKEVRNWISKRRITNSFFPDNQSGQRMGHRRSAQGGEGRPKCHYVVPSPHCRRMFQEMKPFLQPQMLL